MSEEKQVYGRILKSSSIVGGAQGIKLLIRLVRVKFVAVLLGPTGLGLQAMFITISGLASTLSGLGINSSGVRDVAEAVGTEDQERIARTVITLRRMCLLTGVGGALLLALFSKPISILIFQSDAYTLHIVILSVTVLLGGLSAGQMALIQGMRRIGDLARINVITASAGSVIAVGFFWWLGVDGIIPSLLNMAVVSLIGSYYYARRISIMPVEISWRESFKMAGRLVSLGLAFMWTGLLGAGVEFLTRTLIIQDVGLVAVGIYAAAFALSGMFINFVLGAMGADFYPSLTAVSHDHKKMRDLVNHQTEIGLLLAVPGLLATLALAPWVIQIFYTEAFSQSADLLQWFALGCLGRVISWPMGFVVLAKGRRRLFAITETVFNLTHLGLIWIAMKWIGLEGVAIAFFVFYIFVSAWIMVVSRHLIGFSWSVPVRNLLKILLPIATFTMIQGRYLPVIPATVIGCVVTVMVTLFCVRGLCERLGEEHRIVCMARKLPFSQHVLPRIH